MLAGCAASGSAPITRSLPEEPAFARPVLVADPQPGEAAVAVAARERAGRLAANRVITGMRAWYSDVRVQFAAPQKGP